MKLTRIFLVLTIFAGTASAQKQKMKNPELVIRGGFSRR